VQDDTRLRRAADDRPAEGERRGKVVLLAHFDRPKGKRVPEMS
jgi:phosphoglycerate kinase